MKIKEKHFLLPIPLHRMFKLKYVHSIFINLYLCFILFDCTQHKVYCMGELIKIIAAVDDDREKNIENET